ncbi:peroxisome biogenesis factor [Cyclospora cayetanensis]|uniref:Peroxisomal ATPase PEX1 n=1 Tax=Cyclospora cayetanensis TaxID=88456 RepID=A0A1D3D864_9EIME|nr:peroxisome biogenesis factor [Cyclospora cayetanensis]
MRESGGGVMKPMTEACFVRLSGPPSASILWQGQQRHFCRVLQLQKLERHHQQGGVTGAAASVLAKAAASLGSPQLLLNLGKGERVAVAAVDVNRLERRAQQQHYASSHYYPLVSSLEVIPLTSDDWEAVQLHAESLEDDILQQVAVLLPGRPFPLWIGSSHKPALLRACLPHQRVGEASPRRHAAGSSGVQKHAPFVLLSSDTELYVRPLAQAAFRRAPPVTALDALADGSAADSSRKRKHDILRVLPSLDELDADGKGLRDPLCCCGCCCCCCCCCCHENARPHRPHSPPGGSRLASLPYLCYMHPSHVKALQQRQQWLLPALRTAQPSLDDGGARPVSQGQRARLQTLHSQRLAAAEEVAVVRVGGALGGRTGGEASSADDLQDRGGSHAILMGVAAAHVPLGCVRLPLYLRRLYGWFISSRVSVAPCVVPPTLPSSLLLTPLTFAQSAACFPPEHSVSEEDAGAGRPHDPSKKNRLSSTSLGRLLRAALLQSEDGRSRLLDAFLGGLYVQTAGRAEAASVSPSVQKDHHLPPADEVCNAPPSKTQDLPEAPAPAAFCSLLGLPLWNGALVRLALHLSSDEVARLLHSHSALQQREPEKPHAELAARATIPAKERAEDGAETSEEASTESRPSAFLLTRELRELEDGLGDLYVASSDTGSGGEGGAAEDPRSSSPEHPCARPSLPAASGGSPGAQLQEPLEWAKVAAHCSVVEESGIETFRGLPRVRAAGGSYRKVGAWISSESPGETVAGPRTADATGGWSSPPAAAEETPAEGSSPMHHVALDVLVSFSSADTQEGLATSPSAQRNGAASAHMKAAPPHFSRSLPPVFAPLCHHGGDGQMREEDAGPHSEDDACVLLNDALRGLVRQGALRAAVTEPLRVLVGSAGSSDSCGDLRLPLRHGGASCETFGEALPRRLRGEHQTSRSVPSPAGPKANDASGRDGTGAVRLKCSQLVIDPEAFRAAQRLWWLLPPTLSARLSAADAYTPSDSASGFEARLLRLLQQGCVETPAAELPLCSCGGQRGCATPIDFLLHLSSVVSRPLLADFQGLKAFGNCPDALKRAGKALHANSGRFRLGKSILLCASEGTLEEAPVDCKRLPSTRPLRQPPSPLPQRLANTAIPFFVGVYEKTVLLRIAVPCCTQSTDDWGSWLTPTKTGGTERRIHACRLPAQKPSLKQTLRRAGLAGPLARLAVPPCWSRLRRGEGEGWQKGVLRRRATERLRRVCTWKSPLEALLKSAAALSPLLTLEIFARQWEMRVSVRGRFAAMIVHCRLLAREAMPSVLIRHVLSAAFEVAEANSPSLLLLEDLDVLCLSGEDGGNLPTVAHARGTAIAAFLCDLINGVSEAASAAGSCRLDGLGGQHGVRTSSRRVLTLATSVNLSSLHPLLARPSLFGSSKVEVNCDTCKQRQQISTDRQKLACPSATSPFFVFSSFSAHPAERPQERSFVEVSGSRVVLVLYPRCSRGCQFRPALCQGDGVQNSAIPVSSRVLRAICIPALGGLLAVMVCLRVRLSAATTERGIPLSPPQAVHPASNHLLPVGDARAVTTDAGSLRDIANQLEGYSLADFQAVVSRAVGESLLGYPLKVSEALTSPYDAEKPPLAFIQAAHLRKALADRMYQVLKEASDLRVKAIGCQDLCLYSRPNLRYCHVGGLHKPKEDLHDLLTLQRRYPLLLRASGIAVHQGVLLIGPPGCGKTHLALAAVGEAGIRCIHIKGPELLGKFIGSSEAAVRDVFQRAKAAKPCAILFDEIEALATKRGADTTGVTDRVVNQLLCYLDGIEARECSSLYLSACGQDVFVIATTARPDLVDSALLRPGRFDKVCFCGLPQSDAERQEILAVALKSLNSNIVLDTTNLASMVPPAFTPADIQAAVKQAQLYAVQEALAACTGDGDAPDHAAVTKRHLTAAIENAKPSLSIQVFERPCARIENRCSGLLQQGGIRDLDPVVPKAIPHNSKISALECCIPSPHVPCFPLGYLLLATVFAAALDIEGCFSMYSLMFEALVVVFWVVGPCTSVASPPQELQRYHRYCLPIVNKACHESIRVLENVLLHSSQENRSKGHSVFNMEKLTDKKKPTAESPTLECVQSPMRPPGSTQCLHESESNSEADLEEAFKSGEVILSPTLPPSPGSATVSPRIGTFNGDRHDPSIIPELDASMCKIKALGDGNKLERGEADRSCNNGLPAEKKRKRKKLPAQLAGNRVALA